MKIFASIIGISGKMGKEIKKSTLNSSIEIIGGVGRKDFQNLKKLLKKSKVAIDFSTPSVLDEILNIAIKTTTPLVLGTTGYSENDFEKITKTSKKIPIFYSSNFSIGIALIREFSKLASKMLKNSEIDIIEKHHISKKDKQSGTAITLANDIKKSINKAVKIHSIRTANIAFEHSIFFTNENESIEIKHSVHLRSVFANGAIQAAKFIYNKKPGLYAMKDLIGGVYVKN
ncbi:MAG: 4-hydroxy-tetrahydrodipicolinate reductase [Candidatus Anoxychlamydiales bacterium]|nr:4-hydroxy-tetrahydrodipicolinate reductase [Candidatus Anoxychlamydiales bacterium]